MAPEPSTRIAASGRAIRVINEPKIEIVAAPQTRMKAWLRQSGEANGLRTRPEHTALWARSTAPFGGLRYTRRARCVRTRAPPGPAVRPIRPTI